MISLCVCAFSMSVKMLTQVVNIFCFYVIRADNPKFSALRLRPSENEFSCAFLLKIWFGAGGSRPDGDKFRFIAQQTFYLLVLDCNFQSFPLDPEIKTAKK